MEPWLNGSCPGEKFDLGIQMLLDQPWTSQIPIFIHVVSKLDIARFNEIMSSLTRDKKIFTENS